MIDDRLTQRPSSTTSTCWTATVRCQVFTGSVVGLPIVNDQLLYDSLPTFDLSQTRRAVQHVYDKSKQVECGL